MHTYMPMLVVRMREGKAAIQLNGSMVGEASDRFHLALPLSESGDYYIGVFPLFSSPLKYYPVMCKLSFREGKLQPPENEDIEIFEWPDRIFEALLTPGKFEAQSEADFPFTVDQLQLDDGSIATLYYDNGMKFVVEEGTHIKCGIAAGDERTGKLRLLSNGLLVISCGEPNMDEAEIPEEFSSALIVLDSAYQEIIRLQGDAVGIRGDNEIVQYTRLNTALLHDKKQIYHFQDGSFISNENVEIGFFTHSPLPPVENEEIIRAFCDAVQYGLWNEAMSYLTPALKDGLDEETICACMGEFIGTRLPFVRKNCAIGLLYEKIGGITPVRVFSFTFDNGMIDNMEED